MTKESILIEFIASLQRTVEEFKNKLNDEAGNTQYILTDNNFSIITLVNDKPILSINDYPMMFKDRQSAENYMKNLRTELYPKSYILWLNEMYTHYLCDLKNKTLTLNKLKANLN